VTWRWVCDSCTGEMEQPITVTYYPDGSDDSDDDTEEDPDEVECQFCSFGCVAAWSMTQVLER